MRHKLLVSALSLVAWASRWWAPPCSWCFAGRAGPFAGRARAGATCPRSAGAAFDDLRPSPEDPYSVLGLPPGTRDEAEVRAAARRLIKLYHPDVPSTGDADKFQAVQRAAQQLLEPGLAGPQAAASLERIYRWDPAPQHSRAYGGDRGAVPSSAAAPLRQADFAGSRGERVDVAACNARRRPELLRKTPRLAAVTHVATPETLARVRAVLARQLGVPEELAVGGVPLEQLGFFLEGQGSVGMQYVADVVMALEEEFGVELLTILVGTWVRFSVPGSVSTVQDLADFVESKIRQ